MIGAFTGGLPQPIELGPNDNWEVGLCEISYPPNTVGTLKSVNVVGDTTALVYFDVISPKYVGKLLVRCLRTFIYRTMYGEHVFDYIYYLPVKEHTIKSIGIEILQLTGKRVEFKSSKTPTKIVLHFRRVSHGNKKASSSSQSYILSPWIPSCGNISIRQIAVRITVSDQYTLLHSSFSEATGSAAF